MASATYRDRCRRKITLAHTWAEDRVQAGARQLARVLDGVGDHAHERLCVNAVALIHSRALTDAEVAFAGLTGVCASDIAGVPWRVVWERGEAFAPSTQPCANGELWVDPAVGIPQVRQCGHCVSCVARAAIK